MIGYIHGKVLHIDDKLVTVLTSSGVGYTVNPPHSLLNSLELHQEIDLYIQTVVREDDIMLFGFENIDEKKVFNMLTEVNKVGPRLAMAVLSAAPANHIVASIAQSDTAFFNKISGIGKKTAEKIIIDLKDKVLNLGISIEKDFSKPDSESTLRQSVEAETGLTALGYNKFAVKNVLAKIKDKADKRAEDIVREALKIINENKK